MTIILTAFVATLFVILLLLLFRKKLHDWLIKHATLLGSYRALLGIVAFPLVLFGGIYTYIQFTEKLSKPEITLEFEGLKNTAVSVRNISKNVVRDPMYQVVLYNVDSPEDERFQPLWIPVQKGDYIRVNERLGPMSMLSLPLVQKQIKLGHRLIGYATVSCPNCTRPFYWIYIRNGFGGWYSKMPENELPDIMGLMNLVKDPENAVRLFEEHVPLEKRKEIK